jgi:hypothetical protein
VAVNGSFAYSAAPPVNAGGYNPIQVTFTPGPGVVGYTAANGNANVTINVLQISVTASANPSIMIYGGAVPSLSAAIASGSPSISSAAATALATADGVSITLSTPATPTSLISGNPYPVNAVVVFPAAKAGNYSVTVFPGQITITDAGLHNVTVTGPTLPLALPAVVQIVVNYTQDGAAAAHPTCAFSIDGANPLDPTATVAYSAPTGSGSCTWTNHFSVDDVYTVTVKITEANGILVGATGAVYYKYVVIYNPAAGWVSGNGTFTSYPGSYPALPGVGGTGKFGFVSKYAHGANVPSGSTGFQLKDAKFKFVGTSQIYLTITGAKAQYTGSGTTMVHVVVHNGDGDCDEPSHYQVVKANANFILTAIDGDLPGGANQDGIRIKITDPTAANNAPPIYDNMLGSPLTGYGTIDDPNLFTPQNITSGKIEIHKGN